MTRTLVLQSHTQPLPYRWIEACLQSVRRWAAGCGFDYRFVDDALFEVLPADLQLKTRAQPVVASDLARLLMLQQALNEGYNAALWLDADCLCFAPDQFELPTADFALGREVWVQHAGHQDDALRAYVKVHNAFLLFTRDNSFLAFYIGAATRLLRALKAPCPPQFIGPKFLTAVHNIALCPVAEAAGMFSPLVVRDLLRGGGPAVDLFRAKSPRPVAAANLCASLVASGEIASADIETLTGLLLANGQPV